MLEIKNRGKFGEWCPDIFTPEAESFLEKIAARFSSRRETLLDARNEAQRRFDEGAPPGFHGETKEIRASEWQVAEPPAGLLDRRVEITAPAERKKIIQALNSPAKVFMADLEDSLSPVWENIARGQQALFDAARGDCTFEDAARGKTYALNPDGECRLIVRPRGWHLPEKNILWKGRPLSGALADFALFFFHCAKILHDKNRGPYFYLPKTEHWREAALWNDIMDFAEKELALPPNCAKATLLVETLPAVFQMHEILHAMRGRLVGLNCGRWDYIFSYIKTLNRHAAHVLPQRAEVTMASPFMRAYSLELISVCHRRGAHAMGGMSAFIPIRDDENANRAAMAKVLEDKKREAGDGHDGTWVAHPGLIPVAAGAFDEAMPNAHQKHIIPPGKRAAEDFLTAPEGEISLAGFDNNIQVALRYISAWLGGAGAVPIFNMMEDAATAEISRAQLWQWMRYSAKLSDGREIGASLFASRLQAAKNEMEKSGESEHLSAAADILESMATATEMPGFLTLAAYPLL
ncbi:MAG: malate synthase A [Gammaproteobacteria bacterium]